MKNLSYKYLIKPTKTQKEDINRILDYVTRVRSIYIDDLHNGIKPNSFVKDLYEEYIERYPDLLNCDKSAIINELFVLNDFKDKLGENDKKKLHSYASACFSSGRGARVINDEKIFMPKVGEIKIKMHRPLLSGSYIKSITIIYDGRNGKYYASILLEVVLPNNNGELDFDKSIGLDYSADHLIVDSNGIKYSPPMSYRLYEEKISKLQSDLSKTVKYSDEYFAIRKQIRDIFVKITNQRDDYSHKLSRYLANNYDYVCVETLNMEEMSRNLRLGKSTKDNAYSKFLEKLAYKLKMNGKMIVKINKWYPSSKRCHACGFVNENLTLDDRIWICPNCGCVLDRDINAAENIRDEGIKHVKELSQGIRQ